MGENHAVQRRFKSGIAEEDAPCCRLVDVVVDVVASVGGLSYRLSERGMMPKF